jgi:hypothetical protein
MPPGTATAREAVAGRSGRAPWVLIAEALFPDYNAAAIVYWCGLVVAGAAVVGASVFKIAALPAGQVAEILLIAVIAALVGLFPLRIPKSKNSIAAGDVFIFLMLLLHGPFAAALAAAAESGVCAWRTSKRWSSRLASPAAAAVAMLVCGHVFELLLAQMTRTGIGNEIGTFAALMLFAVAYFFVSPTLVTTVIFLKRRRAPSVREWFEGFGWMGMAYAGSASVTAVLYLAFRQFGVSTVVYATPMVGMFLATLHYYFARRRFRKMTVVTRVGLTKK